MTEINAKRTVVHLKQNPKFQNIQKLSLPTLSYRQNQNKSDLVWSIFQLLLQKYLVSSEAKFSNCLEVTGLQKSRHFYFTILHFFRPFSGLFRSILWAFLVNLNYFWLFLDIKKFKTDFKIPENWLKSMQNEPLCI